MLGKMPIVCLIGFGAVVRNSNERVGKPLTKIYTTKNMTSDNTLKETNKINPYNAFSRGRFFFAVIGMSFCSLSIIEVTAFFQDPVQKYIDDHDKHKKHKPYAVKRIAVQSA